MADDRQIAAALDIDRASVMREPRLILDQLGLTVAEGQHTATVGPNGSGKSTLVAVARASSIRSSAMAVTAVFRVISPRTVEGGGTAPAVGHRVAGDATRLHRR